MKKLITQMKVTAADSVERTISGRIVTFEETGNTSIGKTQFAKGSIEPAPVLLNLEHDRARRIGKTLDIAANDTGIDATFKISQTTAGTDALVEAADGLRDGFSVEVSINEYETLKDGTVRILAGELTGVALTSEPAIRSARVSEVAASEEDSESTPDAEETTNEGDEVDNTVTQADAVETVEAAQSVTAAAAVGGFTAKPRIEVTAAKYMENKINAALGDEDAKRYVLAADNTTDNSAFNPTPQLTTVINGLSTMIRPSIDAISRGTLPNSGLQFEIPKITTAPTAAAADEDAAFSETDQQSSFLSVTVKKFASQQKFSVELLTRGNSPAFYDELYRNMVAAMAKAQNAYVSAALVSAATADGTTTTTYPTAAELLAFVGRGAASVYNATAGLPNPFATRMIAGTGQWQNIMSLNDSGRPIYIASQPQNAGGALSPTSLRGNVAGLDFYVDPSLNSGDADGTLLMVNPDAYTWYEDPAQYQLRAESTADGSVTIGLYSFGALANKIAAGAFKNNKA